MLVGTASTPETYFQVDPSASKAICFQNYSVENVLAGEHSGSFIFLMPSAFIWESEKSIHHHFTSLYLQNIGLVNCVLLESCTFWKRCMIDLPRAWVSDTDFFFFSPSYFGKNNQLMDAGILFQNKAWLWLRS